MKKYIQYNAAQYASPSPLEVGSRLNPIDVGSRSNPIEVGSRSSSVNSDRSKDDCSGLVLDLSGKNGKMPVSMATNQNWPTAQDSALDLSSSRQNVGGQAEALDLSKPSAIKADSTSRGLFPISSGIHQSGRSMSQTPPSSNVTKPPIGQYSLLQAALNSTTPSTVVHPALPETANLDSKARMIAALAALEASRGIKPFANLGPRPFGLPIPPLSYPNPPVTVIQGIHKPIAITAPQPHVSNVESKSQTSSQTTISVSQSNHISINNKDKLRYTASSQGTIGDKLLLQEGYPRDVERYVLQTQTGSNGVFDNSKMIPADVCEGFTCFQCKKAFKTKAALKLHATVHKTSDERQYECTMCKRRFLHRHHLVVHQRKHSGEKPFRCDACGKTFMAIFLLHKHLRKHVRESGPNCLIASEQLTQLNVKKDTMDFSEFEKVPGSRTKEMSNLLIPSSGSVSVDSKSANNVLSDAEKIAELHRMNLALLSKQRNIAGVTPTAPIEIIDLSSDELNSSHGSGKDQNFFCKDSNLKQNMDNEKIRELSQENSVNEKQDKIDSEDFNISSQAENLEGGKCVDHQIAILHPIKQNHDISRETSEENSEVQKEQTDKPNPFPTYTSDDEVELDFETGELKVTSRQTDNLDEKTKNYKIKDSEILNETNKGQSCEAKIRDQNDEEIDNTVKITHEFIEDAGDEMVHDTFDDKAANNSLNETELISEDKSAEMEIESTNTEKDDEQSPVEDMKGEQTNNGVNQTAETKSDRNIFEDVGNDTVIKDCNMNEQNICEEITELSEADVADLNIKVEESDEIVNLNLDGKPEDLAPIIDEQLINSLSNIGSGRNRKSKKSRRGRRVKCEICSRTFHSNHHLILHMAVHKKNQMLQSLKKAKAQQMKSMGYQQQKTNVVCQICKKGFKFQKSLNSHMRVHSEKMAKQKELSKAFRDFMLEAVPSSRITERTLSSPSGMSSESHLMSKYKESVNSGLGANNSDAKSNNESHISDCVEYFDPYSKEDRQYDPPIKVIIGKDNIKRYLCHACDNTYTTKQKLRMHALIHKDNCFLCDICGKSFFRLLTLEKHIATHKLPRPHICCDCRKSFIHRSSLMRHRVIHEKPNQPSVKQQVEDINFELKMLDTYSMLRKERLQQLRQNTKLDDLSVDPANCVQSIPVNGETKDAGDALDLSVRVKLEDVSLPPVLSPANTPNNAPTNPLHLSPPVITGENCQSSPNGKGEPAKLDVKREPALVGVKQEPAQTVNPENDTVISNMLQSENNLDGRKRRYSEELLGPNEGTSDTFHKKSRKTRVYQTSCRFCKEKFPNVMMLKSHMTVHNTVETHLYECSICNHRFTQSCSLLRHLKTSCQENRLKCVPCGKSFHHKQSYNQHMKLHNGIPPNLDGSFYDKRKDEVEGFQVKEERESDIENNNSKSLSLAENPMNLDPLNFVVNQALKAEPISIQSAFSETKDISKNENVFFDQNVLTPGPSQSLNTNYDSDNDDAKTFIYSEGKGRLNDLNDFSDNEEVPDISDNKKSGVRPQSVDSVSSSGAMTLNLLSAVCSDIRNAEKEEETRRKEQEERQKELETIEILANLKRGRLQSNTSTHSSTPDNSNIVQGERSVLSLFNSDNTNLINSNNKMVNIPQSKPSANFELYKPTLPYRSPDLMSPPLPKGDHRNILNVPQIPTVVFEIAAEAEKLRQERLSRLAHPDIRGSNQVSASKDCVNSPTFSPQAQFLQNLSQMTLHERLSLLMKAQIPHSSMSPSQSIHSLSPQPLMNKSLPSAPTHTLTRPQSSPSMASPPTQAKNIKLPPQVMPQDLSIKKLPTSMPSFPVSPPFSQLPGTRLNKTPEAGSKFSSPVPPTFHCELCGKLIYNHVEYQHHLQEHLHAIQMKGHSLLAHQRSWVLDRSQSLNTANTQNLPREDPVKVVKDSDINAPPSTLDLTIKKSLSTASSGQDLSSPMTSSDFSNDTIPSPSTPSSSAAAMNLDLLRKELRNKIYARRRSQGLEELTVEFKSPEPSEMTDEERAKLDYRRECNRQAAQRSRMRKKDLVDSLIEELHQEEIVNSDLRQNLESLTAEKKFLLNALDSHMCVKDKAKSSADATTKATKPDSKGDDQS